MNGDTHSESMLTLFAVGSVDDIEGLVKESEVVTGKATRTFVVAGADRLFYELTWSARSWHCLRSLISYWSRRNTGARAP